MVASPEQSYLPPMAYLAWEVQQPLKYEYVDGQVYGMTGGTIPHNAIAVNLIAALRPVVREWGCRVLGSDAKVAISEAGPFFYPDVLVTCDDLDREAIEAVRHPNVIIEVLSAGTEAYDRGAKFAQYRKLESLQEYILIDSTRRAVDLFRLNERGKWELTAYGEEDRVQLSSLQFECSMDVIYEDIAV